MGLREDILALAAEYSGGKSNGSERDDLLGAFGMSGDDANEFLEAYADKYGVDMSEFRWEFHYIADEPPYRRRVFPLDKDGKVIPFMPVTLPQLVRAAGAGRWRFDYPEHTLRTIWVLRSLLVLAVALMMLGLFALLRF